MGLPGAKPPPYGALPRVSPPSAPMVAAPAPAPPAAAAPGQAPPGYRYGLDGQLYRLPFSPADATPPLPVLARVAPYLPYNRFSGN
jgi:hypothetical protein